MPSWQNGATVGEICIPPTGSGGKGVEGIHLTKSYLEQGSLPKKCIFSEDVLENAEAAEIIKECQVKNVDCVILSKAHFKEISVVENGINLLFLINVPLKSKEAQLIENALLLDNVQDPGNVGTILRTTAAAGVKKIYCSVGTASVWSPKVLRAGMGAQFVLDIYESVDLKKLIQESKAQVLAATLSTNRTIYKTDLTKPTAWIIGNEGSGISQELLSLNVQEVMIPQAGNVESLNASAAAAVCLFEQVRQQSSLTEQ